MEAGRRARRQELLPVRTKMAAVLAVRNDCVRDTCLKVLANKTWSVREREKAESSLVSST